jgi:hypothetical protein
MSSEDISKDKTMWFLSTTRSEEMFSVKCRFDDDNELFISEVTILHRDWHWSDGRLVLPNSYEPYKGRQLFTVIKKTHSSDWLSFHTNGNKSLGFFNSVGVELLNEIKEHAIDINDMQWAKAVIGEFSGMRSNAKKAVLSVDTQSGTEVEENSDCSCDPE